MRSRWVLLFISFVVVACVGGISHAQARPAFRVYLTFEDGPTTAYTPQILDILGNYNVPATFFPNGNQITGKETIVQRVIREGHALGNHMWEEPGYYSGATEDRIRQGYLEGEEAIIDALAPTPDLLAIYQAQQKLFRQPGGAAQPLPAIDGVNAITYNWHVDSNDCGWFIDPTLTMSLDEQSIDNILGTPRALGGNRWNALEHGDGTVIVFHDINRVTGRILPTIIEELRLAGATFHVLPRPEDAAGTMPIALGQPPVMSVGIQGVSFDAVLTDYAYIRTDPNVNSPLLVVSLPPQTSVTLTGRYQDWFRVVYNGQEGWMYEGNLRIYGPIPSLPLTQPT
ncbi:MAG: polysaccharide deacetylase family protein [Phototrophicaceae bacterium]